MHWGADLNDVDLKQKTPLHYAASFGVKQIVESLLQKKVDINKQDDEKMTPLQSSCKIRVWHFWLVILVFRNPLLNSIKKRIVMTVLNHHYEISRLLLKQGAAVEPSNVSSLVCLFLNVSKKSLESQKDLQSKLFETMKASPKAPHPIICPPRFSDIYFLNLGIM